MIQSWSNLPCRKLLQFLSVCLTTWRQWLNIKHSSHLNLLASLWCTPNRVSLNLTARKAPTSLCRSLLLSMARWRWANLSFRPKRCNGLTRSVVLIPSIRSRLFRVVVLRTSSARKWSPSRSWERWTLKISWGKINGLMLSLKKPVNHQEKNAFPVWEEKDRTPREENLLVRGLTRLPKDNEKWMWPELILSSLVNFALVCSWKIKVYKEICLLNTLKN